MHVKITALLDPKFLSLILWVKTRLCNQHTHLGLLGNWSYAINFKSKHNSRINISISCKIMSNLPKVYLSILRS
jgi:hypothetical protein